MSDDHGLILPRLLPPRWARLDAVLCEPLIGDNDRWNEHVRLPWIGYGVDHGPRFDFFGPDVSRLVELRSAARATLTALSVEVTHYDLGGLDVLELGGMPYAAEKTLDPGFMRRLEEELGSPILAVGLPSWGRAIVTAGTQDELTLRRFVALIEAEHAKAPEPIFALPVLVQSGQAVGILRLVDEDEEDDEGLETLVFEPE